jgi:hypothetical protein
MHIATNKPRAATDMEKGVLGADVQITMSFAELTRMKLMCAVCWKGQWADGIRDGGCETLTCLIQYWSSLLLVDGHVLVLRSRGTLDSRRTMSIALGTREKNISSNSRVKSKPL